MSFVEHVLEEAKYSESPRSYWYWAALSAIAATVKRQVWWEKGLYKLYPNLYVLIVGPSGIRKGLPVVAASKLARGVGIKNVITGRASIQAVLAELAKVLTHPDGGGPQRDSTAFIANDEFSTAFVRDMDTYTILTKLYDGHFTDEWANILKSSGKEEMKNVCINLIGAVNQAHFNDIMNEKEVSGGFIGRTLVVLETQRARKNSLVLDVPPPINYEKLIRELNEISKLRGPVTPTQAAKEYYHEWYMQFSPESMEDKTGTANRIHDTVLKVATLLTLSRHTLETSVQDIEEALEACAQTTSSVDKVILSKGDQEFAKKQQLFVGALLARGPENEYSAKRSTLLSSNLGGFDHIDLERIVENLETAGLLETEFVKVRSRTEPVYKLTPKFLKLLESKIKVAK